MSDTKLAGLRRDIRAAALYAIRYARSQGIPVTVTSGRRSLATQRRLYAEYLSGRSRFPAAPPGQSLHEQGRAWDSWVAPEYVSDWVAIRRAVGFRVPDTDWIHAEY